MEEGQIDPGDLNNSADVSHLQEMAAQSQSEAWFGPMGLLTWRADAMFWPLRCKTSFDFQPVASQLATPALSVTCRNQRRYTRVTQRLERVCVRVCMYAD